MRQFSVPQFIEVEDKIFGPLTLKQFIYLLGGGATTFILYVLGGMVAVILLGVPVVVFALALAFYKINNQPFLNVVANAISHYSRSKLYVWKKIEKRAGATTEKIPAIEPKMVLPRITESKLKDLSWSLDVKEKVK